MSSLFSSFSLFSVFICFSSISLFSLFSPFITFSTLLSTLLFSFISLLLENLSTLFKVLLFFAKTTGQSNSNPIAVAKAFPDASIVKTLVTSQLNNLLT